MSQSRRLFFPSIPRSLFASRLLLALLPLVLAGSVSWGAPGIERPILDPGPEGLAGSDARSERPSIAEFMTPDGRFDMERLREAKLEGAIDLSGFRLRMGPAGGALQLAPLEDHEPRAGAAVPDDANWWGGFGPGGTDGYVTCLLATGGAVYVGGYFTLAGGVAANSIASWDGTEWHALGDGVNNQVNVLSLYQGMLVAGGYFTEAGGIPANRVAFWDGAVWSAAGTGMDSGYVSHFAEFGGHLYAGGSFTQAGGVAAASIARWDGAAWNAIGSGVVGTVQTLGVYGGALIVGGQFTNAGGLAASNIARWNGASWSLLGAGVWGGGASSRALAMQVHNGSLYVGGYFSRAGAVSANNIARWDGIGWTALGDGVNSWVEGLCVQGNSLVAAGWFTWAGGQPARHVAIWSGFSWSPLGSGLSGGDSYPFAYAVAEFQGELIVGGFFDRAGEITSPSIAAWTGSAWRPLGEGIAWEVTSLAAYDGDLVAAGSFTQAGMAPANFVARWDGTRWHPLGSGTDYPIAALGVYNGDLIAAGGFGVAGGVPASCIARWDGNAWSPLGSGLNGWVYALTVWNGLLVAGGEFGSAGGVLADHIAAWNGSTWSPVGGGTNHYVRALASYGGDLYAAGSFSQAGGVPAYIIARWNGASWSALGAGLSTDINYAYVRSLGVYAGSLIVGGAFTLAGGNPVNNIARWDGASWSALGQGIEGPGINGWPYGEVWALAEYNGDLIACGDFMTAGGGPASGIARWDGAQWQAMGSGVNWGALALATFDGSLYTAGWFDRVGDKPSWFIARWSEAPAGVEPTGVASNAPAGLECWPSPFTGRTTLRYEIPRAGDVHLAVYDARGSRVATLVDGVTKRGSHVVEWRGRNDRGAEVPAGVYYLRMKTPDGIAGRRIVRIR